MSRSRLRTALFTLVAVLALLVMAVGPTLSARAHARPTRVGAVTGLTVEIQAASVGYRVAAAWYAATNATSYRVVLTDSTGAVLSAGEVGTLTWAGGTTLPPGSVVKVTVTARNGSRHGRAVSTSRTIPDLKAPTGSYDVAWTAGDATVTQTALADDGTAAGSIARQIHWGEPGGAFEPWASGASVQHAYPLTAARYVPRVRLTDQAGNVATLTLHAVVVNDHAAPTGAFAVTPTSGWSRWTGVNVVQSALADDFSPAAKVERVVTWGDGSVTAWPAGATTSHVYPRGGSFAPVVTLRDEAGNTSTVTGSLVTVRVDATAPVLRLTLPRAVRRVASWTTLRGTATDAGVGVRHVRVRAVERRGPVWYAYRPARQVWVQAGATRASAMAKAGVATVVPGARGVWTLRLARLKVGTLVFSVSARDRVGNTTRPVVRRQVITIA